MGVGWGVRGVGRRSTRYDAPPRPAEPPPAPRHAAKDRRAVGARNLRQDARTWGIRPGQPPNDRKGTRQSRARRHRGAQPLALDGRVMLGRRGGRPGPNRGERSDRRGRVKSGGGLRPERPAPNGGTAVTGTALPRCRRPRNRCAGPGSGVAARAKRGRAPERARHYARRGGTAAAGSGRRRSEGRGRARATATPWRGTYGGRDARRTTTRSGAQARREEHSSP